MGKVGWRICLGEPGVVYYGQGASKWRDLKVEKSPSCGLGTVGAHNADMSAPKDGCLGLFFYSILLGYPCMRSDQIQNI